MLPTSKEKRWKRRGGRRATSKGDGREGREGERGRKGRGREFPQDKVSRINSGGSVTEKTSDVAKIRRI